jgi:chromosome segregation ATPase
MVVQIKTGLDIFNCLWYLNASIKLKNHMNLAQALKKKNRLAGEIVRFQQIFQRENARRNDSSSQVDREDVWEKILSLSDELGELKSKITQANVDIYPALERMSELKSRIAVIQVLNKREGEELIPLHGDRDPLKYTWDSFINQATADEMVAELQEEINDLQDKVDKYNATTQVDG